MSDRWMDAADAGEQLTRDAELANNTAEYRKWGRHQNIADSAAARLARLRPPTDRHCARGKS